MDIPYTVAMLATETGVLRRTVINHIAAGQLRAVKLGDATSAWLIPADEAARYIEAQRGDEAGAA